MKKLLFLFCLSCYGQLTKAQLTNNGQLVHLNNNALVTVKGEYYHKAGIVKNNGTLSVLEDFTNDDVNSVVFDNSSTGLVVLNGAVDQSVKGNSSTVFPNLTLTGAGDKWLGTNISVTGVLDLTDRQLHADFNRVHILNPNVDAIARTVGFISTDNTDGALIRKTNSTSAYRFPMGSKKNGVILYRPVDFAPDNSLESTFSANLSYSDPGVEGFDATKMRHDITNVWDKYYFVLGQKVGNSKYNVTFYQNSEMEKSSTQLVNWEKYFSVWGKASPSTVTSASYGDDLAGGTLNTSIMYTSAEPFQSMPFTFSGAGAANLVNPFTFFNAFSPDGDGKNDTWFVKNIELYPDNKLSIFNRWGDEVYNAKGYTNAKGWDGANVQPGTYYYVLNVNIDGKPRAFKGFITMIKR